MPFYDKPAFHIGPVAVAPPLLLAPMAGATDHVFRALCKRFGAGLVCTELISSHGLRYGNRKTGEMLYWSEEERPVSAQIFGGDPDIMADAARRVEQTGVDILDINMGCSVPKVVRTCAGAALMRDPALCEAVLAAVVRAVSIPVTVKMRKGWKEGELTAVEIARIAESVGVRMAAVHGRTARQLFEGEADWESIARVKASVSIPVVGNGDVRTPEDAVRMFEATGCDGVMVGRAAMGYPWIFREIRHFIQTGERLPPPSPRERVEMCLNHLLGEVVLKGEKTAVAEMKSHIPWYLKGLPGSAPYRQQMNLVKTAAGMEGLLHKYMEKHT
ncbi:MAG: tRNA dihydrouridine synthase DusB [Armatimonadetes bacterium]|nr:tRNA dihydrouridine synthase DusB [Armatimonadota bacterium]